MQARRIIKRMKMPMLSHPMCLIQSYMYQPTMIVGCSFHPVEVRSEDVYSHFHGVIQKVLPVLSTETVLHIWLSTEYYGFRPSSTAVDTGDTWG